MSQTMAGFPEDDDRDLSDYYDEINTAQPKKRGKDIGGGHLNTMIAHAATIINMSNVLGETPKVQRHIENLNNHLIQASKHLGTKAYNKHNPAKAQEHLRNAIGEASSLASGIAATAPNTIAHHESQAALTAMIAAHNNLTQKLAEGGK